MVDVVVEEDCGNAPKKVLIKDWLVSLATGEIDAVTSQLTEDAQWDVAGSRAAEGMKGVSTIVAELGTLPVATLVIGNILSHGKRVAADGSLRLRDGREVRFAYFFTFSGHGRTAKISEISTYAIDQAG
ncbi:MAG: nuclear transport factor 2 family protein [Rubrobacteraceae bacterium]